MTADLIGRMASDLFARHCSPEVVSAAEGTWPAALWTEIETAGLTKVGLPEDRGGTGGGWVDIGAVLGAAGRAAAPVPLAETLLAARLLCAAGIAIPDGPLTLADRGTAEIEAGGPSPALRGRVERVPWATESRAIAVVARRGDELVVVAVPSAGCRVERGLNMAREPRDLVTFDGAQVFGLAVVPPSARDDARLAGALARAILMSGALDRVLRLTVEYAGVREQFGRPIARFQAIQHGLAILAGEAAAASAAVAAAVEAASAADHAGHELGECLEEIATAKVRVGAAVTEGARIAHQLHGAIGATSEHQLRHFTARLWSWRDEYGGEREWAIRLGRAVAGSGPAYWERLTRVTEPAP